MTSEGTVTMTAKLQPEAAATATQRLDARSQQKSLSCLPVEFHFPPSPPPPIKRHIFPSSAASTPLVHPCAVQPTFQHKELRNLHVSLLAHMSSPRATTRQPIWLRPRQTSSPSILPVPEEAQHTLWIPSLCGAVG